MEVVCGHYGSYHTQLIEAAKDDTWKNSKHVPGTVTVLWLFSSIKCSLLTCKINSFLPVKEPALLYKYTNT
jgi:hypothetical protein